MFYFQWGTVYTGNVISRRALLAISGLSAGIFAACGRRRGGPGFRGYAYVANEDGQDIAVVDLEALAVARHIPLAGNPTAVLAGARRPFVYALTAANGTVHEVAVDRLQFMRKLAVASAAVGMQMTSDDRALYILAHEPKALIRVDLDGWKVDWRIALPEEPVDFALAPDDLTAAITFHGGVRLVDIAAKTLRNPAGTGDFGAVRFLSNGKTMIAADRGERRLSFYETASSGLITHLPLAVRPDNLCFNGDGGQLFVTGDGMDAVVIVYPFHTPEVAETVLAGHEPGPLAVSRALLFVASPGSGGISILEINSRKVIAVASVGTDPGYITVTPDDQYALVLNRSSGDMAVLRVGAITKNRDRRASLLTVIPVGSRPVSAVVRAV